jgi:toxin ParE1/3/4
VKLRWLRSGRESLRRHIAFITADNPAAAARVRRQIKTTVLRLCEFPQSGRIGHVPATREMVVTGLPYVVVYRVPLDSIEILRVFHTSMNWTADNPMQ